MFTQVHDVEQMFGALNLFRHGANDGLTGALRRPGSCQPKEAEIKLATNVYDNGESLVVQVEVAGVAKEDLSIQLQGKHLTIKGNRKNVGPHDYAIHRQDIVSCSFSRAYTLPLVVAGSKVTSSLVNGILTLTLPKAEEAKVRDITIQ